MSINYKKQLYANSATTYLTSGINDTDTTISVSDATKFPNPGQNEYFLITLDDGVDIEIIEVHGRTSSSFINCVRGCEGTTAKIFMSSTQAECRVTAQTLASFDRSVDRLTRISTISELESPELTNNHSYIVDQIDDSDNPILVVAGNGKWGFVNFPNLVHTQAVTAASAYQVDYAASVDLSVDFTERSTVIQFITGANQGQCRLISFATNSVIGWAEDLPFTVSAGDIFEVYKSSKALYSSIHTQMPGVIDLGSSYSTLNGSYDFTSTDPVIVQKRSETAGEVPAPEQVLVGEVPVNTADAYMYVKHTDNVVRRIGTTADRVHVARIGSIPAGDLQTVLSIMKAEIDSGGGTPSTNITASMVTLTPASTGGTGASGTPLIIAAKSTPTGYTEVNVVNITVTGLMPNEVVSIADVNATTNGNRFSISNNTANSSGVLTFSVTFNDTPASSVGASYTLLLRIGSATVYVQHARSVIAIPVITTPSLVNPVSNSINPTYNSSAFATTGSDTHYSSDWQVASDSGFNTLVTSVANSTTSKTSWTPSTTLPYSTTIYIRVRYKGSSGTYSSWSPAVSLITAAQAISTPTIVTPSNGSTDVGTDLGVLLEASTYTASGGVTHVSTTWQLSRTSDFSTISWTSKDDSSNLESIRISTSALSVSTQYYARVVYKGSGGQVSSYSPIIHFTTSSAFTRPSPGASMYGGYYAGRIMIAGKPFALIVSPKSAGESFQLQGSVSDDYTSGATSVNDGYSNSVALNNLGNHPAAAFCRSRTINGYSDWYLPSKDELELCYRNLKPTTYDNIEGYGANSNSSPAGMPYTSNNPGRTSATQFQLGGDQAFSVDDNISLFSGFYWTSTCSTNSTAGTAYVQSFKNGNQQMLPLSHAIHVRAVRRFPI